MGDRQDIDALDDLMMGSLYGELDAADEARLEAHLASHPGDQATMDALADTRTRVRDGLSHMHDLDPAPAISTLILQEAARRAPRKAPAPGEKHGVFAWLANAFQPIARHPALAGAMALMLVAGTAGVLYEKGKVTSHERVADDTSIATPIGGEPARSDPGPAPAKNQPDTGVANGDRTRETEAYQVKLAEQQQNAEADGDDAVRSQLAQAPTDRRDHADNTRGVAPVGQTAQTAPHRGATGAANGTATRGLQKGKDPGYVEVTTLDRQPKQLDDQVANPGFYAGAAGGGGAGQGQGAANAGPSTANAITAGDSAAPPPAQKSPAAAPGSGSGSSNPYNANADAKLTEWAKVQHSHMLAFVKAGNCVEAGKLGGEIAAKAPDYYAAFVENDRGVRACKQYIDSDKRKKANEQYKSRARNTYEPDMEAPAAAH